MDTVNSSGGLEGHLVQLIADDDTGTPGTSVADAQTLISDHVDAIVDSSLVGSTWASAVQAAGVPVVGSNESETMYYTNPDFFPIGGTQNVGFYAIAATAKAAGATNLGLLYCAESVECSALVPPITANGQRLGVPVVYHGEVAATAPNYTAQCLAAKEQHVSTLGLFDAPVVLARIGQNCAQQGYTPIYVMEGEAFSTLLLSAPGIMKKLWAEYTNVPFWANSPGHSSDERCPGQVLSGCS